MKIALYLRVANKSQLGLNIQEQRLRKYAEENGHEIERIIEETVGGLSCDRPGLNELLEIPSADVQGVLVTNISRIGRDVFQVADWNQRLTKSGKKLITVEDDEDLLSVLSELSLQCVPNAKKSKKQ